MCVSHRITHSFNKCTSSYSVLNISKGRGMHQSLAPCLYMTCGSFGAWCTVSEGTGRRFTLLPPALLFLLPISSYLLQLVLFAAPSSALSSSAAGRFREGCVNMRKSIPSLRRLSRGRSETWWWWWWCWWCGDVVVELRA